MNSIVPATIIVAVTALIGLGDLWNSGQLVGSIMYTLPLALCALQRSKRLLWGIAGAAVLLTIAAGVWRLHRVPLLDPIRPSVNRGILIASLVTLTIILHCGMNENEKMMLDAEEMERQGSSLLAENERLENLVATSTHEAGVRKEAEERLAQIEEGFRLFVSNVKDSALLMLDQEGRVVSWNEGAERIKGYRAEEIIGQHFSRFYSADDVSNGKPGFELEEAKRSGRFEDEGWRIRKDGSRFLANVVITALRDERGQLRGFGKITRDVTERRKYEEDLLKKVRELKHSNYELQQFAYVASHDLQEPLRMVASYTQLLAKRYRGRLDSDADEFIAYAVDGCNRMQRLVEDLLIYSRAANNVVVPHESSSENALRDALTNLRASIKESGAVVTHDSLPTVNADENRLAQVFLNLVGNAIKYRGADVPQVHVSATRNGSEEWIFSVRDNGLGIEPQYFERIFVLFQRLHGRDEFKGTGIGLAICKKIVERAGGRIWVESQPQKGSTFYFSVPEGGKD
jgi:PAS domain S-box-containing protein